VQAYTEVQFSSVVNASSEWRTVR